MWVAYCQVRHVEITRSTCSMPSSGGGKPHTAKRMIQMGSPKISGRCPHPIASCKACSGMKGLPKEGKKISMFVWCWRCRGVAKRTWFLDSLSGIPKSGPFSIVAWMRRSPWRPTIKLVSYGADSNKWHRSVKKLGIHLMQLNIILPSCPRDPLEFWQAIVIGVIRGASKPFVAMLANWNSNATWSLEVEWVKGA